MSVFLSKFNNILKNVIMQNYFYNKICLLKCVKFSGIVITCANKSVCPRVRHISREENVQPVTDESP